MVPEKLERLTRASLEANKVWLSRHPVRKHTTLFQTGMTGRVFKLCFLRIQSSSRDAKTPDYEGRFLLSLGHTVDHNLCAQVWDCESPTRAAIPELDPLTGKRPGMVSPWTESGRAIGVSMDHGGGLQAWAAQTKDAEQIKNGALFAISERRFEA